MGIKFYILILLILINSHVTWAKTIYVNPGSVTDSEWAIGNDINTGLDKQNPKMTIASTTALTVPGDSILIKNGTYTSADYYGNWSNVTTGNGSSSGYIVITAETKGQVIFDVTGSSPSSGGNPVFDIRQVSYVKLIGIVVKGANTTGSNEWSGIRALNCRNIVIEDCIAEYLGDKGIWVGGDSIIVKNNIVRYAAMDYSVSSDASKRNRGGGWPNGMSVWYVNSSTEGMTNGTLSKKIHFLNNTVHDCWGEGIILIFADGGSIENNTVYNCYSALYYIDNSKNIVLKNNYGYMTQDANGGGKYYRSNPSMGTIGIGLSSEPYDFIPDAIENGVYTLNENISIYNNLISGVGRGFQYYYYQWETSGAPNTSKNFYKNVSICFNNFHNITTPFGTSMSNTTYSLYIQDVPSANTQPTGNIFRNNIVYKGSDGEQGGTEFFFQAPQWAFSNNIWVNSSSKPLFDNGTSSVNNTAPNWVGPTNNSGDPIVNFYLSSTSPAKYISGGVFINGMSKDFNDYIRSNPPSIGFAEYGTLTGINFNEEKIDSQISISPNPTEDGLLRIRFQKADIYKVTLMNIYGNIILQQQINNSLEEILDYSKIGEGTYFLKISNTYNNVTVLKFLKF